MQAFRCLCECRGLCDAHTTISTQVHQEQEVKGRKLNGMQLTLELFCADAGRSGEGQQALAHLAANAWQCH